MSEREGLWEPPLKRIDPWVLIRRLQDDVNDLKRRLAGTNVAAFTINDMSGSFYPDNAWPCHHAYELMEIGVADPDGDLDAIVQVFVNFNDVLSAPVELDGNEVAFGIPDLITEVERGDYLMVALLSGYMLAGTITVRGRRLE